MRTDSPTAALRLQCVMHNDKCIIFWLVLRTSLFERSRKPQLIAYIKTNAMNRLTLFNQLTLLTGLLFMLVALGCVNDQPKRVEKPKEPTKVEEKTTTKVEPPKTEAAETSKGVKMPIPTSDDIVMSSMWYETKNVPKGKTAKNMILLHQARFNKSEYKDIALKLNELGFNCLAVDLRSGGDIMDMKNETARQAKDAGLSTEYIDAEGDVVSAVNYMGMRFKDNVILMGSSYSASLALKVANDHKMVDAVIAFSPGEYFNNAPNVKQAIKGLSKPTFMTSTKEESAEVKKLMNQVKAKNKVQFIPKSEGTHGARVLWEDDPHQEEYWKALTAFLETIK